MGLNTPRDKLAASSVSHLSVFRTISVPLHHTTTNPYCINLFKQGFRTMGYGVVLGALLHLPQDSPLVFLPPNKGIRLMAWYDIRVRETQN